MNAERQRNLELAKQRSEYMQKGEAMVKEMRDHQMKRDQELKEQAQREIVDGKKSNAGFLPSLYDSSGKIAVSRFKPKARDLISMTPSQKQSLINKLKYVNKKVEEQNEYDVDMIKDQVANGEINPSDAFFKIQ